MTLDELFATRAARLDVLDLPHTLTQRQVNEYVAVTAAIDARIFTARCALDALAQLPPLEPEYAWRDFLTTARKTLCDELLALPPRAYDDHARGVQQNLKLSIVTIDRGEAPHTGYHLASLRLGALMKAAGYVAAPPRDGELFGRLPWFGDLDEVERRITRLEAQRAAAQAALDEALLDDDARAALDAARLSDVERRNKLPTRKTRADGSQYDRFMVDGKRVDVEVTS